jgi:hypothetical protein
MRMRRGDAACGNRKGGFGEMARADRGRRRTWRFKLDDATVLEVSAPQDATEKQVRRRGRVSLILATAVAGLGVIATAYADNVNADGDTVASPDNINYNNNGGPNDRACNTRGSAVPGSARMAFGGSAHFGAGQTVTVTVTPSVGAAAQGITASGGTGTVPSPWAGGGNFTVAISTTVPATAANGSYLVAVSASSATHTANGDSFSVIVNCPATDTVAPDNASVVADDGATWTNHSSGNVSVDISAHDAVGVTRYRLATSQAGLDSASDVAVSPAESAEPISRSL